MSFRINARTLLHLGSELISSDGIALYELIKNAYDAKSPIVRITAAVALPRRLQREIFEAVSAAQSPKSPSSRNTATLHRLVSACRAELNASSPTAGSVRDALGKCRTLFDLSQVAMDANQIVVADDGRGMSLVDLERSFLTIGTRSKLVEKASQAADNQPILGEKGIGRLSAMRLGGRLQLRSATSRDECWATLDIDWSAFDHDNEQELSSIDINPVEGEKKQPPSYSGTRITISALRRDWSKSYLEELALLDLARLNDPFREMARFPIVLKHNSDVVPIPRVDKWIFDHAHARCKASFAIEADGSTRFFGTMLYGRSEETFSSNEAELLSISKAPSSDVVSAIGPFEVELLWYNRRLLREMEGVGSMAEVRSKLAAWTGGLMMYRDGFRVLPYGGSDDDWLDLDRKALARSGFKLNRAQIIGRVAITQTGNPHLRDQANREGLVDTEEKRALSEILSHLIQQTFWSFLVRVEKATPAAEPVSGSVVERRLETEEKKLSRNFALLVQRVPAVREQREVVAEIGQGLSQVQAVMDDVRQMTHEYEEGRRQLVTLAGIGLTVEILAHELNRATEAALVTLSLMPKPGLSQSTERALANLSAQLKALQKRLMILDPLSVSGRNRKEKVDVVTLARDVVDAHVSQFEREGVTKSLSVRPASSSRLVVMLVKGMVIQILENLLANSLYWLRQQKRLDSSYTPSISVDVDTVAKELRFSDNGPGISDSERDAVFDAFYTKKPSGEGKGLGLFICREIAKYHGATLTLERGQDGVYRTFVLDLGSLK
ncbi:sensor histidine kinase [Methylobacterium sp. NPDC080182]|uniref:sensor histidine kinase n=1 Tax=Methylobacterium sp. NPDC080182 TaxID=3390590 RepID=UPI003CFF1682